MNKFYTLNEKVKLANSHKKTSVQICEFYLCIYGVKSERKILCPLLYGGGPGGVNSILKNDGTVMVGGGVTVAKPPKETPHGDGGRVDLRKIANNK